MQTTTTQTELLVKMTITAWDVQNNQLHKLLNELTDEQLYKQIAPGKNRGIYLLGHLIAVSDAVLPLLDFSELLFPELQAVFIKNPDNPAQEMPSITTLKENLQAVNAKLNEHIKTTTAAQWLERHTAITPEAFINEPHRNKLNVIISRTNHMANHLGQLLLLK